MPEPPPPAPKTLHPELTARAQGSFPDAKVEIRDGHAWLLFKMSRWDLGTTPREARGKLDEQLAWFVEALKTAGPFKA